MSNFKSESKSQAVRNAAQVLKESPSERSCSDRGHCKPAVVLLPIFTVENAPPEKLIPRSGFDMSPFDKKETEVEISDLYGPDDNNSIFHPKEHVPQTNIQNILGNIINEGYSKNIQLSSLVGNSPVMDTRLPVGDFSKKSSRFSYNNLQTKEPHSVIGSLVNEARHKVDLVSTSHSKPRIHDVPKRVFGKHPLPHPNHHSLNPFHAKFNLFQHKKSVFSKAPTFELPKTDDSVIKTDVQPRKDFSSVKNLVQDYLIFKKSQKDSRKIFTPYDHEFEHHKESLNLITTTERFLNSAEEKVMNYNYYLKNFSKSINKPNKSLFEFDTIFSKGKSNDKLMNLLDKLEQEVKHIDLDKNKKDIFDEKIRRIYGTVVGGPGLLNHKTDHESDYTDTELTDFDRYEVEPNRHSDIETRNHIKMLHHKNDFNELEKNVENIHNKYSDFENEVRPISRSQNTLNIDKPNHLNQRNFKKAKEGYESDMKHPYSEVDEIRASLHKDILNGGNDIKSDHIYSDKEFLRTRNVYSDTEDNKNIQFPQTRKFRVENDPLSVDRRKYYQSKLEALERKLHSTRRFKHHKDNNNRQIRPVLPTAREEQPLRPSKNQPDTFYMPDRARFLHGF